MTEVSFTVQAKTMLAFCPFFEPKCLTLVYQKKKCLTFDPLFEAHQQLCHHINTHELSSHSAPSLLIIIIFYIQQYSNFKEGIICSKEKTGYFKSHKLGIELNISVLYFRYSCDE